LLFDSVEFAVFFTVVVAGTFALPHRVRWAWLLVASYAFYMRWNVSYAALIGLSTLVDYVAARRIDAARTERGRRLGLAASVVTNLGLLFTFKYWAFFHESAAAVAGALGLPYSPPELHILLPVGISFYTFQTLSYTIDVYREQLRPERHLGRFALYVAYFPQLVAGPIERATRLLPQLRAPARFDLARAASGLQLMAWGLFKKVVIADRLAIYVDAVYADPAAHNAPTLWLATYAFAFQIYCDFSGYSDIAIGAARVLGVDLMKNFERPYFAQTITDFWRRWHISLSTWLRDYLYISLGGNRRGALLTYRNLLITMLLGGLWHGASWNFVVWGAFHGVLLAGSRITLPVRDALAGALGVPHRLLGAWRAFVTFQLVCVSWVLFRAPDFRTALEVYSGALSWDWGMPFVHAQSMAHGALGLIVLAAVHVHEEHFGSVRARVATWPTPVRWAVWIALALGIVALGVEQGAQFIYFQF
jgi:D-alanyl-lipoteichoic acid acyltransferase DltB (MBOAT superfamily)